MATLQRNLKLQVRLTSGGTHKKKLTHIVCTIGPKTKEVDVLVKMMEAGMDIARLNFSHGNHQYHGEVIDNVRAAVAKRGEGYLCGIMLDTKGPEIRTGKLKPNSAHENKHVWDLKQGSEIIVTTDTNVHGDSTIIALDYKQLCHSAKVGGNILIADGTISLTIKAINIEKQECLCVVNNQSRIGENKNCHLPGAVVELPTLSEKDKSDLTFGVEKKVDYIAASFIRTAKDVIEIREFLGEAGKHIKIISKIESTEGVEHFDEILKVSDGIMVARGDLGVELPMEQIFIAQKMMVSKCNAAGKPVITATQMLESMIINPRPTRAEATDVANAVLDGTDCVMLSGETASGDYPLEAITYMSLMASEAETVEAVTDYPSLFESLKAVTQKESQPKIPEVVCSYAVRAANDLGAAVVIVMSETGYTARMACKYRPRVPVLCVTASSDAARYLLLSRAVVPLVVPSMQGTDQLINLAMEKAKKDGYAKTGDTCVVISGLMEAQPGNSNNMRVITIL